ncbi:MAG: hypothetical protein IJ791_08295 [Lachnospiraceae bacterium]|nr:hypothetical protein [Lachnospiraceae bacterium]
MGIEAVGYGKIKNINRGELHHLMETKSGIVLRSIFAILASFIFGVGRVVYADNSIAGMWQKPGAFLLVFVCTGILFYLVLMVVELVLDREGGSDVERQMLSEGRFSYIDLVYTGYFTSGVLLILLALYIICYLTYFPGIFGYDIDQQTWQITGSVEWNNHHPVLHTLIWKAFYDLEKVTGVRYIALVGYSVVQMAVVLFTVWGLLRFLQKQKAHPLAILLASIYYICMPTLAIFSFITTKDVYFACALTWLMMSVLSRGKTPTVVILAWLTCMLRNNMVYALLFAVIIFLLTKQSKRLIASLAVAVALAMACMNLLFPAMGIAPTETHEAMSVPIQQIGRAFHENKQSFTKEQIELTYEYVPDIEMYNPRNADKLKTFFNDSRYEANKGEFWRLYLSIGKTHPLEYVDAFLTLHVNYWYILAEPVDPISKRVYIETCGIYMPEYPVERALLFPNLFSFYENVAAFNTENMVRPLLHLLFAISTPFVVLFLIVYDVIRRKRKCGVLILAPYLGLYLTYLLGPLSNFRYVYPYFLAMPLLVIAGLAMEEKSDVKENLEL